MGCFEGSGVPVLYIGRTVPKESIVACVIYILSYEYISGIYHGLKAAGA